MIIAEREELLGALKSIYFVILDVENIKIKAVKRVDLT
jgi:hypothetical protein